MQFLIATFLLWCISLKCVTRNGSFSSTLEHIKKFHFTGFSLCNCVNTALVEADSRLQACSQHCNLKKKSIMISAVLYVANRYWANKKMRMR